MISMVSELLRRPAGRPVGHLPAHADATMHGRAPGADRAWSRWRGADTPRTIMVSGHWGRNQIAS